MFCSLDKINKNIKFKSVRYIENCSYIREMVLCTMGPRTEALLRKKEADRQEGRERKPGVVKRRKTVVQPVHRLLGGEVIAQK